jgi:hypothetical protein
MRDIATNCSSACFQNEQANFEKLHYAEPRVFLLRKNGGLDPEIAGQIKNRPLRSIFNLAGDEGFGHKYFLSENFATPSQLGGVTAIQVSDSQTADLQFSPPRGFESRNPKRN